MKSPEDGRSSDGIRESPGGGGSSPSIPPGTLLAGRYEVLRFIASGGMGEVYEAQDRELGLRVALKVLRREIARDAGALELFKREIQLARKVTHPSVCRIFDLGIHRQDPGGAGAELPEVVFLTMELLEGETLSQRLEGAGRLSTREALPIARQICEALSAAHAAGVIHRDLKCGNVVLVPGRDGERAVVTDFGLARAPSAQASGQPTVSTLSGTIFGTPAYVAPEQIQGGAITPATDVYALGVVLFQMVTGELPFSGETAISAAVKRLTQPPPPPRTLVPDLDARWEKTILRCLEKDPARRFQSAADVAAALEGRGSASRLRPLLWAALACAALAAAAGTLLYLRARGKPAPQPPAAAGAQTPARKAVAVLWFQNLSGKPEKAWLSTALSEMISTELAAGEKLRVISRENVARTRVELALPDSPSLAADTLLKIRANLGADYVVLGAYAALGGPSGGPIRLDVQVQDAASGESVDAFTENGTEAQIFELVSKAGAGLRQKLGGGQVTAEEAARTRAVAPSNPEAVRLYAEGLEKMRLFETQDAVGLLEKAVSLAPENATARAALSEAWQRLGYREKARAEAKKAFDLSGGLPRQERMAIEGRYRETIPDWPKAEQIYDSLLTFYPDSLEYGLRLAQAQVSGAKAKAALATIGKLRNLPPPGGNDPRIDLAEARADQVLGDFRGMLASSETALEKGRALGARFLVAQALIGRGSALRYLGESAKARVSLEEASSIYRGLGDLSSQAKALRAMSIAYAGDYDYDGFARCLEQAIALYRKIGDKLALQGALQDLAQDLQYDRGDLKRARALLEESVALCRELGESHDLSLAQWKMGNVLIQQGDLAGAKKAYAESLALARAGALDLMVAYDLWGLAEVASAEGDLSGMERGIRESLGTFAKAQAAEAREWESLSHVRIAQLRLDQGRPAEAEAEAAGGARALAGIDHLQDQEKLALFVLAFAQACQGEVPQARESLARAEAVATKIKPPSAEISWNLARARTLAAIGQQDPALKAAEGALDEAGRLEIVSLELEAKLALGEIELGAGKTAEGRARLAALEKEARQRGFLLIASKATKRLGRPEAK